MFILFHFISLQAPALCSCGRPPAPASPHASSQHVGIHAELKKRTEASVDGRVSRVTFCSDRPIREQRDDALTRLTEQG